MKFSDWVNRHRIMLDMDLRSVSDKSNIHFSTVNRIENDKTDPTMVTFINIVNALQSNPSDVYTELTGITPSVPNPDTKGSLPTRKDVLNFLELKQSSPDIAGEFLADQFNQIYKKLLNQNEIQASKLISESPFSVADINRILFPSTDNPENYFLKTTVRYPPSIKKEFIIQAYLQNAVLIIDDLKMLLSCTPSAKNVSNTSQTKQRYSYHEPLSVLSSLKDRFMELEQVGRSKLSDILDIDKSLSENGEFFMMVCHIVQEETRENNIFSKEGILLILLSRWTAI